MDETELIARLRREGFSLVYAWEDVANAHYGDHTHTTETAHIILNGEMTLILDCQSHTYRPGDRCDVPRNAVHSAIMGPRGCRYLMGER